MNNIGRMVLATNGDTIIMVSERVYVFYHVYTERFVNFVDDNGAIVDTWIKYSGYKELS